MVSNFAFLDLDMPELLIILAIVLLLFGGKKLPELSKSIGESVRELRKGITSSAEDEKKSSETKPNKESAE